MRILPRNKRASLKRTRQRRGLSLWKNGNTGRSRRKSTDRLDRSCARSCDAARRRRQVPLKARFSLACHRGGYLSFPIRLAVALVVIAVAICAAVYLAMLIG